MNTCPTCQKTYPDDFSLCPRDGAPLTAQATETEAQLAAGLSRRFRLVRRLGKGGMGTVFLAEQTGVGNRPVALKVLNRKLLDDPDFLLRFQNEAGSTGRIHHPNVVTIYESAQSDRRKQVEPAKRQRDNYYDNGEYDQAINAYQEGLKLDPSNAPLFQALQRARAAKAAEEKFNH